MLHRFFTIMKTQDENGVIDDAHGYGRRHWGMGTLPPVRNSGVSPRNRDIYRTFSEYLPFLDFLISELKLEHFLNIYHFSDFPIFPKKVGEIRARNRNFGVGGFDSPKSVPHPSRNFVATPLPMGKWNI